MTDKQLLVYVDLEGEPQLVGRLWARSRKGRESASFEYDASWLKHPSRFALEPALVLSHGQHHTAVGRRLFGAIGDSCAGPLGPAADFSARNGAKRGKPIARRERSTRSII